VQSYKERFADEIEKIEGQNRILLMTLPSIVEVGEELELRMVMTDNSGMPHEDFTGKVSLVPSSAGIEAPESVEFERADRAMKTVPGVRITEPGVHFLEGHVEGSPSKPQVSNPVKAVENATERLFWGDIHVHSVLGTCHADYSKSPEFGYWFAKQVSNLDFSAVTDHLRGITPEKWEHLKRLAREETRDGEFVVFLAFESSHSKDHGGDINVYYRDDEAGYFWLEREDMKGTTPKVGLDVLWDWLDDQGVPYISIPHHTGRAGKYRNFELPYYKKENESLLEIFSMWGSSEGRHDDFYLKGGKAEERAYLRDALELGYKYGVIGSSDTHFTMPGTPCSQLPRPYTHPQNKMVNQGLAAVYAPELTREALFDSMMNRNCFATTSMRPILRLWVNGTSMGQTARVNTDKPGARKVRVELCTSALSPEVELLCNNQVIHRARAREPHTIVDFEDDRDAGPLWITGSPKNRNPFFYYYVKVNFHGVYDGITAWSSPIWVEQG